MLSRAGFPGFVGMPAISGGAGIDPAAQALADRMVEPFTGADLTAASDYIAGLKADGVWSRINQLVIFPSSDEFDDAILDWTATQDVTQVGAPFYDPVTGVTTNGTNSAIDLVLAPTTATLTGQDDISFAIWVTDTGQYPGFVAGSATSSANRFNPRNNLDLVSFRLQGTGSTPAPTVGTAAGLTHFNRLAAGVNQVFRDGVQLGTDGTAASAAPTAVPFNLGRANTVFTAGTFLVSMIGRSFTPAQALAFYNRTETYLAYRGAV